MTLFAACGSDDEPLAKIPAQNKGTFVDPRDGEQYGYATYAGMDWMTENFRYNSADDVNSTIYLDADENGFTGTANYASTRNLQRYGRLYTLAGARAACPAGWRLPTDQDWQRLEMALGMSAADTASTDWRGRIAPLMLSIYGNNSDLNMLLGGYYFLHDGPQGAWSYMGAYGYYWSDTRDDSKEGEFYYVRKFASSREGVCRISMEPASYKLSVRFVRDAN